MTTAVAPPTAATAAPIVQSLPQTAPPPTPDPVLPVKNKGGRPKGSKTRTPEERAQLLRDKSGRLRDYRGEYAKRQIRQAAAGSRAKLPTPAPVAVQRVPTPQGGLVTITPVKTPPALADALKPLVDVADMRLLIKGSMTVGAVLAQSFTDAPVTQYWVADPKNIDQMADAMKRVLEKYGANTAFAPELALVLATLAVFGPPVVATFAADRKLKRTAKGTPNADNPESRANGIGQKP